MDNVINCLCGAAPVVERKPSGDDVIKESFKYKCPNCKEKELPWLGQWNDCGALQEWNRIALKRSYHKRTLEYNVNGICISPPFITIEWINKKSIERVTIDFYYDNSMYYFCFDYSYMHHGHGFMVGINDRCYPSLEMAKKIAMKKLIKSDKNLKKIADMLLLPKQGELFGA